MSIKNNILSLKAEIPEKVTLVAVSKTKPISDILQAYETGHLDFGENKIQEMVEKFEKMPKDIHWHMIGHVQTNKVKYMADFVHLIHGVDSLKLLKEINKQGKKSDRVINCLLQIKIAEEDSKFGMDKDEAKSILNSDAFKSYKHVNVKGLMGMATFTDDEAKIKREFTVLQNVFNDFKSSNTGHYEMEILSMGMSSDYSIAIDCGSNMVRIGSSIFGERNYT